jgi:hypothetical protein
MSHASHASHASHTTEEDAIRELGKRIQHRFSHDDIRDIYRIIHLLLEVLTENEHYVHHYNKHHIIMQCLYRFYAGYPHSRVAVHSYSAYVSERLREIKRDKNNKQWDADRKTERTSFCRYCVIS